MKKFAAFSIMIIAVLAFVAAPTFACDGDKDATTTTASAKSADGTKSCSASKVNATTASAKSADGKTCSSSKINATTASAKSTDGTKSCGASKATATTASAEQCHGISKEECLKIAAEFGDKCEIRKISVDGMTCGGCETGVKTALEGVDGVLKVVKVSHTDKFALVVVDPAKVKTEALTTAVTNKGFKAQMASATIATDGAKKSCAKTCAEKKAAAEKTGSTL